MPTGAVLNSVYRAAVPFLAALAFVLGSVSCALTTTYEALPRYLKVVEGRDLPAATAEDPSAGSSGAAIFSGALKNSWGPKLLGLAFVLGIVFYTQLSDPEQSKRNEVYYTRYLIGIGFFLVVDALVVFVSLSGLATAGVLNQVFADGSADAAAGGATWNILQTTMLIFAILTAVLGTLFFFANSLWRMRGQKVAFDPNAFWAGLWFRIGESLVFTIAIFLALRAQSHPDAIRILPVIALFVGISIKSAETLIFGLSERMLAAAGALVGGSAEPKTRAKKGDEE